MDVAAGVPPDAGERASIESGWIMPRYLFIVSQRDPALYALLNERFADDQNVRVILDRRVSDPRTPEVERRTRDDVDREIREHSYAVVALP
jgi:hypothetical protein